MQKNLNSFLCNINKSKEKELEQAAHGVYVSPDAWVDGMYLLHLRCSQGIFSHETALFFHDLTDREPSAYSITVKRGYSTTRLKADGVFVYTIKPEFTCIPQTGSPLATVTASHSASQDFPTLGEPAKMCRPCETSVSTTKCNGWIG